MKITQKEVLEVAKWRYPEFKWKAIPHGYVVNELGWFFNLSEPKFIQSVTMLLRQDYGWKIREKTQSGQKIWRAENGKGGCIESPSLQRVLVMVVMRVREG